MLITTGLVPSMPEAFKLIETRNLVKFTSPITIDRNEFIFKRGSNLELAVNSAIFIVMIIIVMIIIGVYKTSWESKGLADYTLIWKVSFMALHLYFAMEFRLNAKDFCSYFNGLMKLEQRQESLLNTPGKLECNITGIL